MGNFHSHFNHRNNDSKSESFKTHFKDSFLTNKMVKRGVLPSKKNQSTKSFKKIFAELFDDDSHHGEIFEQKVTKSKNVQPKTLDSY